MAVGPHDDGLRLDRYLQLALAPVSRGRVKAWLDRGQVRVQGRLERRAGQPVHPGALIELADVPELTGAPALTSTNAPAARAGLEPSRILFLDDQLLAVDKPAGLGMHAVEAGDTHHLVAAILDWATLAGVSLEPGGPFIVSRLDRDTSGVVLLGLTREAGRRLTDAFAGRTVVKRYRAIVHGQPRPEGVIDLPMDSIGQGRYGVSPVGKPARTRYRTLEVSVPAEAPEGSAASGEADVEVLPETGRTHQIRVHLASIGHPLVGDLLYGGHRRAGVARSLLHAERLELEHPFTRAPLTLEAPLPEDMSLIDGRHSPASRVG
jgi:23S rRNA pseudouridine1911/1915/1917 synthase